MGSASEITHGKFLVEEGPEKVWRWDSPTGILRAGRRTKLLIEKGKISTSDNVLEIGCGTGLFSGKIKEASGASITSIDFSDDLLEIARGKYPGINFIHGDAEALTFDDESFDVVAGSSVLHHLHYSKALAEIFRVLKPGGRMIFAEPNMINPHIFLQKKIPYLKKKAGDSPDESAINRWHFKNILLKKGFLNVNISPYDFLYPATPGFMIPLVNALGLVLEKIPLVREIAGSVIIYAEKK